MKCPEKNIECLNWNGESCSQERCPYENFSPFSAVDKIMEKWNGDDKNPDPDRDLTKVF